MCGDAKQIKIGTQSFTSLYFIVQKKKKIIPINLTRLAQVETLNDVHSVFFFLFLFHYNVHLANREGNHPDDYSRLTYRKLLEEVCRFANVLKMHGVNKGDRVSIYMPMIMELPIAMLACARIGAVHSIVVSTFANL